MLRLEWHRRYGALKSSRSKSQAGTLYLDVGERLFPPEYRESEKERERESEREEESVRERKREREREREKAVVQLELARIESDSSSMIIETDLARVTATGFPLR